MSNSQFLLGLTTSPLNTRRLPSTPPNDTATVSRSDDALTIRPPLLGRLTGHNRRHQKNTIPRQTQRKVCRHHNPNVSRHVCLIHVDTHDTQASSSSRPLTKFCSSTAYNPRRPLPQPTSFPAGTSPFFTRVNSRRSTVWKSTRTARRTDSPPCERRLRRVVSYLRDGRRVVQGCLMSAPRSLTPGGRRSMATR